MLQPLYLCTLFFAVSGNSALKMKEEPMEDHRDQQQTAPPAGPPANFPPAQPQYATQTAGYAPAAASAPARPAGRVNVVFRLGRLLLRRMLYLLTAAGSALRPYAGFVAIGLVLLAIIAVQSFMLVAPQFSSGEVQDTRVAFLTPATTVEQFLAGQREFDAERMWDSFSPRFQAALLERGASKETFQVQIDTQRNSGRSYGPPTYIGGVELDDGSTKYFYLVDISGGNGGNANQASGPTSYVFTVDRDGKIVGVDIGN